MLRGLSISRIYSDLSDAQQYTNYDDIPQLYTQVHTKQNHEITHDTIRTQNIKPKTIDHRWRRLGGWIRKIWQDTMDVF